MVNVRSAMFGVACLRILETTCTKPYGGRASQSPLHVTAAPASRSTQPQNQGLNPPGPNFGFSPFLSFGLGAKPIHIDRLFLRIVPGLQCKRDSVQQELPGRQGKGGRSVRRKGALYDVYVFMSLP